MKIDSFSVNFAQERLFLEYDVDPSDLRGEDPEVDQLMDEIDLEL